MNPLERLFAGFHRVDSLVEATHYSSPRTVGTARVRRVLTINAEQKPQFDVVFLDLKEEGKGDCSATVSKVPTGMFQAQDIIAEVIIKASESNW